MRALVVAHEHVSEVGQLAEPLAERGYELIRVTVVPEQHHHAPDVAFDFPDADGYDLVVSLGAPWSVYDDTAIGTWIGGEIALLRKAHRLGIPVLGLCFGAQALSAALGGSVGRAPRPEIGWATLETDAPDLIPPGPWFQWHYDRFALPPGAVELARTSVCPQAFRLGRSLGVQFHPEVTPRVVRGWLELGGAEQCARQGIDPKRLLGQTRAEEPAAAERARSLLHGFLDQVASAA